MSEHLINEWSPEAFTAYLRAHDCLAATDRVLAVEPAGAGNMNLTLRVVAVNHSVVVKQSVPYVAKYPGIPAPADRIAQEMQFYSAIQAHPKLAQRTPEILHFDQSRRIAVIEDLGRHPDYSLIYASGAAIDETTLGRLADWLAALHQIETGDLDAAKFANSEMLALNHAHIFDLPFRADNGFDLEAICPGLTALAREIQANQPLVDRAKSIGESAYLAPGPVLTHGDFYPGSVLNTNQGPMVIDPEFCALGRREFDLGIFHAHLLLGQQPEAAVDYFLAESAALAPYDASLVRTFAGIEIIRRMIGIAQLPAHFDLRTREDLLRTGARLALSG